MKKLGCISISIAAAILLALSVCSSVWDFEIANAIYIGQTPSENPFGIIASYVGIIPTFVGWSFLGASILCLSKKQVESTAKRRWLATLAILLFVLSFFYFCNTLYLSNANAFKVHFAVAYSIGAAVLFAAAYFGYKLAQKSDDTELLNKVLLLVAVSLVTLLIISITKELMCRPRFRFVLATGNIEYFKNWWQSGREIKASLGMGIESDEFASLPSGHSAYSMFAIFIFPALADYISELKKFKPHLFALGFIWWTMTALSRLTVGAHYLTDVTIAGLVTILAYVIVSVAKTIHTKCKKTKRKINLCE
jgi:membrane-associated phospholipid phosphatase